jgi:hypothetical protein
MENNSSPNKSRYHLNGRGPKRFTEKLQEAFLLRCLGLTNFMIKDETGLSTEKAVIGLIGRAVDFFPLHPQCRTIEAAIAMAVKDGFLDCLIERFRSKHAKWIEPYEKNKFTAPATDLPCWEAKRKALLEKKKD